MNVLGVDFGRRFLGLALAFIRRGKEPVIVPLRTLVVEKGNDSAKEVFNLCLEYGVGLIVVGLPRSSHSSRSLASAVQLFVEQLKGFWPTGKGDLPPPRVVFVDEFLTSFQSGEIVKNLGVTRRKKTEAINSLSAVFILQNFLSR